MRLTILYLLLLLSGHEVILGGGVRRKDHIAVFGNIVVIFGAAS